MKNLLYLWIIIGLFSCGETPEIPEEVIEVIVKESIIQEEIIEETVQEILIDTNIIFYKYRGYYVGNFDSENGSVDYDKHPSWRNRINISLDSLNEKESVLYGHSIVAGNKRPFQGEYSLSESELSASVKEPGDNKYDGIFNFTCNTEKEILTGKWISNDKKLAVTKREYKLVKKEFKYNPDLNLDFDYQIQIHEDDMKAEGSGDSEAATKDITKFNASNTKLKSSDIENMYKTDLEIIRNAIYARHGYSFKNRRMRYFFDRYVDWYIPVSTDVRSQLTPLEKDNIELLKRYEEHADKYYDYFGR